MSEELQGALREKVAEFERLYVKPEIGIVKVELTSQDPPKLSVWVSDWSAMQKVGNHNSYEGIALTWGFHIPEGAAFQGGGALVNLDEPGPPVRRNHADVCKCAKCSEANAVRAKAKAYSDANKHGMAKRWQLKAIALLEQNRPLNHDMAEAYREMCFILSLTPARKKGQRRELDLEAIQWYEKAIAVWEGIGSLQELRGNLTNLGSFYYCLGDYETALVRELRGLELEKLKGNKLDDESVSPFNHVAGCYLMLGRLDEAEATIRDGFAHIGDDTPNSGYLWGTLAKITEARAKQYRKRAEELVPPESCSIG